MCSTSGAATPAATASWHGGQALRPGGGGAGHRRRSSKRLGLPGTPWRVPDCTRRVTGCKYELTGHPKISVLIPNKDHIDDLDRCLTSLYKNAGL